MTIPPSGQHFRRFMSPGCKTRKDAGNGDPIFKAKAIAHLDYPFGPSAEFQTALSVRPDLTDTHRRPDALLSMKPATRPATISASR